MTNRVKLYIQEKDAGPLAEKRFAEICRFDLAKEAHRKMMDTGCRVRDGGRSGIEIKASLACFGEEAFADFDAGILRADGVEVSCPYFQRISRESVKGAYIFLLTAGECAVSDPENIMEMFYADVWGTAYADAGMELLRKYIREDMKQRWSDGEQYLSNCFGPGYFGMPVSETKNFYRLLDGELLDVRLQDSGLLIPQKSCTGLYLVCSEPQNEAEPECLQCCGNSAGCSFCAVGNGEKRK